MTPDALSLAIPSGTISSNRSRRWLESEITSDFSCYKKVWLAIISTLKWRTIISSLRTSDAYICWRLSPNTRDKVKAAPALVLVISTCVLGVFVDTKLHVWKRRDVLVTGPIYNRHPNCNPSPSRTPCKQQCPSCTNFLGGLGALIK